MTKLKRTLIRLSYLSLLIIISTLFVGCISIFDPKVKIVNECPSFPVPSEHVVEVLEPTMLKDPEVLHWFNDLLKLQKILDLYEEKK